MYCQAQTNKQNDVMPIANSTLLMDELYEEINLRTFVAPQPTGSLPDTSFVWEQLRPAKHTHTVLPKAAENFAYFDISPLFHEMRQARQRRQHKRKRTPSQAISSVIKLKEMAPQKRVPVAASERRQAQRKQRKFSFAWNWFIPYPRQLATCAFLASLISLSLYVMPFGTTTQVAENTPSPLSQVMVQNRDYKVASFRQEVTKGNYFVNRSNKPIHYVSKSGDTVQKLSKKFHLKPATILRNNKNLRKIKILKPGMSIKILPVDGIAHPVAKSETLGELSKRYDVALDKLINANALHNPNRLHENQEIIIPNATSIMRRPTPAKQLSDDNAQRRRALHSRYLSEGDDMGSIQNTGNHLTWPTRGVITSGFGWRWFSMHAGLDIAAPTGTPIAAVKEGVVVYSGWMGGYGQAIDISHGNGMVTRYGHCSELYVQVGQRIRRGQTIAAMGSTGHSTGPHLHFEVHLHGNPVNPSHYF